MRVLVADAREAAASTTLSILNQIYTTWRRFVLNLSILVYFMLLLLLLLYFVSKIRSSPGKERDSSDSMGRHMAAGPIAAHHLDVYLCIRARVAQDAYRVARQRLGACRRQAHCGVGVLLKLPLTQADRVPIYNRILMFLFYYLLLLLLSSSTRDVCALTLALELGRQFSTCLAKLLLLSQLLLVRGGGTTASVITRPAASSIQM